MSTRFGPAGSVPSPSAEGSPTRRVCPLLEREAPSRVLDIAPPPWVVRECSETGFVFLENPPGYDSLREDFAWEVTWKRESEARRAAEPVRYAFSGLLKQFRRRILKRNKVADLVVATLRTMPSSELRLLDIGCGWGDLMGQVLSRLPRAWRKRCIPHGIELSNELARIADETLQGFGGRCIHDTAIRALEQLPEGHYDLLVLASVLEHELQPLPLLRLCQSRLKPGGVLVVKVPNYGCWNRRMRGPRWCGFRWPDHVNYFTAETLKAMGRAAGLRVRRLRWQDRSPLSDSLYALFERDPALEATPPR